MRLQRSVITPTGGVPTPLNLPVRPLRTVACGGRSRPGLKRALALDLLANGREPVVHKVHVDNRGGQAVIADTVQTGGERIWTTPCTRKHGRCIGHPAAERERAAGNLANRQRCLTAGAGCMAGRHPARPRATGMLGSTRQGRRAPLRRWRL